MKELTVFEMEEISVVTLGISHQLPPLSLH